MMSAELENAKNRLEMLESPQKDYKQGLSGSKGFIDPQKTSSQRA
jgi:hypothetical protein